MRVPHLTHLTVHVPHSPLPQVRDTAARRALVASRKSVEEEEEDEEGERRASSTSSVVESVRVLGRTMTRGVMEGVSRLSKTAAAPTTAGGEGGVRTVALFGDLIARLEKLLKEDDTLRASLVEQRTDIVSASQASANSKRPALMLNQGKSWASLRGGIRGRLTVGAGGSGTGGAQVAPQP